MYGNMSTVFIWVLFSYITHFIYSHLHTIETLSLRAQ